MTLKEKLDVIKNYDEQDPHETFMRIADDYAIEFAEWVAKEFWLSPNCKYSEVQTSKELLEIFKKEKGL
jgi:hypothetical protein